jgi:hypothetical protein
VEPGAQPKGADRAAALQKEIKKHFIRQDFNGFA